MSKYNKSINGDRKKRVALFQTLYLINKKQQPTTNNQQKG